MKKIINEIKRTIRQEEQTYSDGGETDNIIKGWIEGLKYVVTLLDNSTEVEMMDEALLVLESWLERYRCALQEIADASATSHHAHHLSQIAQSALDGEPTTADEHNIDLGDRSREEKIKKERK